MRVKKNHIIGLIGTIVGIFLIISARQYSSSYLVDDPGPGIFPTIAGIICVLSGLSMLLPEKGKKHDKEFLTKHQWIRLISLALCYLGLWLGMKYLGYKIAVPIILFIMCSLMTDGQKVAIWKRILFSLLVSVAMYYLFQIVLSIRLPIGKWTNF